MSNQQENVGVGSYRKGNYKPINVSYTNFVGDQRVTQYKMCKSEVYSVSLKDKMEKISDIMHIIIIIIILRRKSLVSTDTVCNDFVRQS